MVAQRGGVMLANSQPVTRTVMRGAIRNHVVQFIESGDKGRESWSLAYTPVALARPAAPPCPAPREEASRPARGARQRWP